jgi:tetratricopeptide (TPR) repeat protein
MVDVFISYSRLDKDFVGKLREALIAQQQEVWIDWESIPPSQAWWSEIQKGIARANNFVVVLSPASMASPICQMEIEYARQLKKRIVPVLHADYDRATAITRMAERLAKKDETSTREIWGSRQPHDVFDANDSELKHINYFFFKDEADFPARFADLFSIIRTDYAHKERHTTLELRALEWDRRGRDTSFLLIENELKEAQDWLAAAPGKEPAPTDLHHAYIDASARRTRQLRTIRRASVIGSAVAVIAVLFAVGASVLGARAVGEANSAGTQVAGANAQLGTATVQQGEAERSAAEAGQQLGTATVQQGVAEGRAAAAGTEVAQAQGTATQIPPTLTQAAVLQEEVRVKFDIARNFSSSLAGNFLTPILVIGDLTRIIETYPDEANGYVYRAYMYFVNDQADEAITDYTQAILLEPVSNTYNSRAAVYLNQTNLPLALADYNTAIQLDPLDANNYTGRGNVFLAQGQIDAAFADYDRAIELDPSNGDVYVSRGRAYLKQAEYDLAMADFNYALELDELNVSAYLDRGDAYLQQQEVELAFADYNRALELAPQNPFVYSRRGGAYRDINQFDMAILDFSQAIALQPRNATTYSLRASVYSFNKQYDLAIEDFSTAIELDPQFAGYYRSRAATYSFLTQYDLALADWNTALSLDPEDAHSYSLRGDLFAILGDYAAAIADYSQAINLDPLTPDYYIDRGDGYYFTDQLG